jgi:hypothetical protein
LEMHLPARQALIAAHFTSLLIMNKPGFHPGI